MKTSKEFNPSRKTRVTAAEVELRLHINGHEHEFVADIRTTLLTSSGVAAGIGELGIVGTAAAVSNAVFDATGIRVRELPIRIEHLLQCPATKRRRYSASATP